MKSKSSGAKRFLRGVLCVVCALMLVLSVSAFRESALFGATLAAFPVIYLAAVFFRSIAKSVWAIAFLAFAVGVLEIYAGIANGMPIAWALGGVVFVGALVWSFVGALAGAFKAAFPKGDLPFPKVSPMTHSFDSAFGATTKKSFSGSSKTQAQNSMSDDDSPNGRGGMNQFYSEDDPSGLHL